MRPMIHRAIASRQRGVVLVVALIFLLLLTILAISASGRSLLQERMVGGLRNAQLAEQAAESAVRGAEWTLWASTSNTAAAPLVCGTGVLAGNCYVYDPGNTALYGASGTVTKFRTSAAWTTTGAAVYKGPAGSVDFTKTGAKLAQNPAYMIEDLGVELPPGVTGSLHESGATGSTGTGYASSSRHIYRITARATGASANTMRVVESTFAAKSN
ncbi:MAG TPA: PilX N-terminal domain-containing pilus assembly protein [Dyella sp.]|uniref:pilus assembly PilX family protein n=1 Tax=Dyella sp. TaxID=1869338 RepID=UPI002D77FCB5|nr:PilX N-terminal domain-containing pilus assembly protein [Dyella sp.]HET6553356.1 PilX N-terminal domain-containing pilus assembly protein [Dyella sp.]